MVEELLKVENLSIGFNVYVKGLRQNYLHVISDLSLDVKKSEIVAVLGSSGSGKSLLADSILGILPSNAVLNGDIYYKNKKITQKDKKNLRGDEISLIPQSVNFLDPLMNIQEQAIGVTSDKDERELALAKQRVIFDKYDLSKDVDRLYPHQISGGMARKVLISTALLNNPNLIIADEPTPGLDKKSVDETINNLIQLKNDKDVGMLVITHDIDTAIRISDRIAILYLGYVIEITDTKNFSGNGEKLYHPYTRALYRALPQTNFELTQGKQPSYSEIPPGCPYQTNCSYKTEECINNLPELRDINGVKVRCFHPLNNTDKISNQKEVCYPFIDSDDVSTLKASNISFSYPNQDEILSNISFELKQNKIVGLFGDSGSGKSTLCKILAGYISNYDGNVSLDNDNLNDKIDFNPIQLIFQHPEKVMNPKWKMDKILAESWMPDDNTLKEFGIQKSWFSRYPQELSGGELQRFSVLRALNPMTKFLIADEMTTMLDAVTQVQIFDSVIKIVRERKIGFLVVSHDMNLLNRICDEIIFLEDLQN